MWQKIPISYLLRSWNPKWWYGLKITDLILIFGEGDGNPLQYSCLENPMDGGAWWAAIHGVARSWIRLSDFTFTFHFHALEKEMATHSSALAWRIPGTAEPGGLPSMGLHRVGHDWCDLAAVICLKQSSDPSIIKTLGKTSHSHEFSAICYRITWNYQERIYLMR